MSQNLRKILRKCQSILRKLRLRQNTGSLIKKTMRNLFTYFL